MKWMSFPKTESALEICFRILLAFGTETQK